MKLLDFGLAKLNQPSGGDTCASETLAMTEKGAVLGTYTYMSPEQLEGKDADARSDIFAFGAVPYEMLTGKRAFVGESAASIIGAILHTEPAPEVTGPVEPMLRRCLAKDRGEPWDSAADLKWAPEHLREEESVPVSRTPRLAWAVTGACLLLAVVSVSAKPRERSPETARTPTRRLLRLQDLLRDIVREHWFHEYIVIVHRPSGRAPTLHRRRAS